MAPGPNIDVSHVICPFHNLAGRLRVCSIVPMGCGASAPAPPKAEEPIPEEPPPDDPPSTQAAPTPAPTPAPPPVPAPERVTEPATLAAPPAALPAEAPVDDLHLPRPDASSSPRFEGRLPSVVLFDAMEDAHDPAAGAEAQPDQVKEESMSPDGVVILVLGGPGSGKDTQCEKLAAKYGCAHLSAVDLLRAAVTSASPKGQMISDMIRSGQIVPAQETLNLIKEAMKVQKGPYLLQGYPKNRENLEDLEEQCGACAGAILLEASEDVLCTRLLDRGKTSNRTDDTHEAIQRRLRTFDLQASPMLGLLRERGVISAVDAGQSAEDVFAGVCSEYERLTSGA